MASRDDRPVVVALEIADLHQRLEAAGCRVLLWDTTPAAQDAIMARAQDVVAIVGGQPCPLPEGLLDLAPNLRLVACVGAGYEHFDGPDLRARGIALTNASGVNSEDVADLALGLLIACWRSMIAADADVRAGRWRQIGFKRRLKGARLGIVGLGEIGTAVARRAEAFGLEIGWHGPTARHRPWRYEPDALALARWADIVMVACRATAENRHLVNAAFLDALGPAGMIVNVSRGSLIDEDALIEALRTGTIGGAGLDVFEQEPTDPARWRDVPNVTLHPHFGGATWDAIGDGLALVTENIRRSLAGEPLVKVVN